MCELSAGHIGLGVLLGVAHLGLVIWALRLVEGKRRARMSGRRDGGA